MNMRLKFYVYFVCYYNPCIILIAVLMCLNIDNALLHTKTSMMTLLLLCISHFAESI